MFTGNTIWQRLYRLLAPHANQEIKQKIDQYCMTPVNCLGTDAFDLDPQALEVCLHVAWWLYRNYFRVQVHGWQHVPQGPMIVAGNHSGHLPFDGMMIGTGFLLDSPQPVLLHSMVDRRVSRIPFVSTLFARVGQITGSRQVCQQLLQAGKSVLVFPEGMAGICKPFSQRYQLQRFGHGFVKIAMHTGCPIVPLALIGAEEQAIAVADIKPLAKLFHLPHWPLILPQLFVPIPLPVRYTLHIGKPIRFGRKQAAPSDKTVTHALQRVKQSIRTLIADGLHKRQTIF
ncbi:MAG: lysophospholipid acyltransferase family protein [Myxococcota bacterium]